MPGLKQNPESKKSTPIFELRRKCRKRQRNLEFVVIPRSRKLSKNIDMSWKEEKLSDESGIRTHAPEDQISETCSAVDIKCPDP